MNQPIHSTSGSMPARSFDALPTHRHDLGPVAGSPGSQRGVALATALILLIVVTLLGLTAIRGTILQNEMAANQYDRQLAFQAAASALQVARQTILSNPGAVAHDCSKPKSGGPNWEGACLSNPFDLDDNVIKDDIQMVSTSEYQSGANMSAQPQYVIESLGKWINPLFNTGYGQTANAAQYGSSGMSSMATYYRVTARSADPAQVEDRAIVVLQAVYMQY